MPDVPRILIAGTHSSVGKTTVTLGVLAALRRLGVVVAPFAPLEGLCVGSILGFVGPLELCRGAAAAGAVCALRGPGSGIWE
jgi:hypothetical protein